MPSQNKLINAGIKYTDSLFKEISTRLTRGVKQSDTLESFIAKTKDYTVSNPLVITDYKDKLTSVILQETNNHKFSRPAQKELTRITIENSVGDLITNVGEDIKSNVRDIVKQGYNKGLSQNEIADNISHEIKTIKNTRARAIVRTEIARTATISDYIINKERGAKSFTVDCRNTACEFCKNKVLTNSNIETTGRDLDEDIQFSIDDIDSLPPYHPNCRCVALFSMEDAPTNTENQTTKQSTKQDTTSELLQNKSPKLKLDNTKIEPLQKDKKLQKLIDNGEVIVSKVILKLDKDKNYKNFSRREKFIKYEFHKDNIIIYESVNFNESKVIEIKNFYDGLPDVLKEAEEIILSNQKPYEYKDNREVYIKGHVNPNNLEKITLFNESLTEVQGNLVHELAHVWDKNYEVSNSQQYKDAFKDDKNMWDTIPNLLEKQKFVTPYAYTFYQNAIKPGSEHSHRIYSEDFAECVKEYIMRPEKLRSKFENKFDLIDKLLQYYK